MANDILKNIDQKKTPTTAPFSARRTGCPACQWMMSSAALGMSWHWPEVIMRNSTGFIDCCGTVWFIIAANLGVKNCAIAASLPRTEI
jgi:hypothetical protein